MKGTEARSGGLAWMRRRLGSALGRRLGRHGRLSYAQCGEDLIMRFVCDSLRLARPRYLDIGAHHPAHLNNTLLFYRQGARGVNVEADPALIRRFHRQRPRDLNLNLAIGREAGRATLHLMANPTLNTLVAAEAERYAAEGTPIRGRREVPVVTVNELLETHLPAGPDLVSIDIEGLDLVVLEQFDFDRWRPALFCVETLTYSASGQGQKLAASDDLMARRGYFRFADTFINSIYVDEGRWQRRGTAG